MSISIIIPFSSEDPHRVRAMHWVREWWRNYFPDWYVLVSGSRPFTKARSVNLGVQAASADTLVIADADCFVTDHEALRWLVEQVEDGKRQWVVPHKYVHRLSEGSTSVLYNDDVIDLVNRTKYVGCVGGGLIALTRDAWFTVGGMDTRFEGWGGEDVSFGMALECLVGSQERGNLDLIHLWHPPLNHNYKIPDPTTRLIQEYRRASRSPDRMRALIQNVAGCC